MYGKQRHFVQGIGPLESIVARSKPRPILCERWEEEGCDDGECGCAVLRSFELHAVPEPAVVDAEVDKDGERHNVVIRHAEFASPIFQLLPDAADLCRLARNSERGHAQVVAPADAVLPGAADTVGSLRGLRRDTPICVVLAASGQEGYEWRRTALALPLAQRGVATVILESPFYGIRRSDHLLPEESIVYDRVSDVYVHGYAQVHEACGVLAVAHSLGFRRLSVAGLSFGASMATVAATRCPFDVGLAGIAPGTGPHVFCSGTLRAVSDFSFLPTPLEPELERLSARFQADCGIENFGQPRARHRLFLAAAYADAYIPSHLVHDLVHYLGLQDSQITWLLGGHISSFVVAQYTPFFALLALRSLELPTTTPTPSPLPPSP
jgi:hypothetical protein